LEQQNGSSNQKKIQAIPNGACKIGAKMLWLTIEHISIPGTHPGQLVPRSPGKSKTHLIRAKYQRIGHFFGQWFKQILS